MLIKSLERGQTNVDWLKSFHSFSFGNYYSEEFPKFEKLRVINQDYIKSQSGFGMHSHHNMEILSLVLAGELTHTDSLGNKHVLKENQIQLMSAGSGIRHSEYNYSDSQVHLLQIWIEPYKNGLEPSYQQVDLDLNENMILLASYEDGLTKINQYCDVWYARDIQDLSFTAKYEHQWIQVINGNFHYEDLVLEAGDGLGLHNTEIELFGSGSILIFDMK